MEKELFRIDEARYSQANLCEVVGISMATANNLIHAGAIRPEDLGVRRLRKPRLFTVITIFEALLANELSKALGTSPRTSAAIARKTTYDLNWMHSVARDPKTAPKAFVVVFWSDRCRDWDAWVEIPSGGILRIDLATIAKKRGEPRIGERPIIVLPVSIYFASVVTACQAIRDASSNRRGA
jgi:hypothetical protein